MNIMPFGPHRDEPIADLPDAYLLHIIARMTAPYRPLRLWSGLASAIDAECERRALLRRAERRMAA